MKIIQIFFLIFGFLRGFGRFLYIAIMDCGTGKTLPVQ